MAVLASDTFTRGNSSDLGTSWDTVPGQLAWQIVANQAQPDLSTDAAETNNSVTWPDDQYSQAVVVTRTGGTAAGEQGVGVLVRGSTTQQTYYRVVGNAAASGALSLSKFVNGNYTSLGSPTGTIANGDTIRCEAQRSTIRAVKNGATQITVTDSSIVSGRAGVSYSSTLTAAVLDSWEGGNLVGLHLYAGDSDHLYTTFSGGGTHTGTPSDGNAVQVWEEESGIPNVAVMYETGGAFDAPTYRASPSCLDFDGTDDGLKAKTQNGGSNIAISDLVEVGAFTAFVSFYAEAITGTDATNPYFNHTIFGESNGLVGLCLRDDSGVKKAVAYNYAGGANYDQVALTIATGQWVVAMVRHEGGNLYLSINGGSESSVASGNTQSTSGTFTIGTRGTTAGTYYNGRMREMKFYRGAVASSVVAAEIAALTANLPAAATKAFPFTRRPTRFFLQHR